MSRRASATARTTSACAAGTGAAPGRRRPKRCSSFRNTPLTAENAETAASFLYRRNSLRAPRAPRFRSDLATAAQAAHSALQQVERVVRPRVLPESQDAPQLAERLDRAGRFHRAHVRAVPAEL